MQAVGRNCDRCYRKISSTLDGDGCIRCDQAFHFACLPSPSASTAEPTCPRCGLGFKVQQQVREVSRALAFVEAQERGGPREQRFARVMIVVSVVIAAVLYFSHRGEPSRVDSPELLPLLGAIGLYFVVCSMRFRTFFLYRYKVARAVRWYGAPIAHGSFLIIGLAALVCTFLAAVRRLPF
jgi:hypothetical protein